MKGGGSVGHRERWRVRGKGGREWWTEGEVESEGGGREGVVDRGRGGE